MKSAFAPGGPARPDIVVVNPEPRKREFFIDNLLVRVHFIIVMIRWTGLAPWEFELPFPGGLISTFLVLAECYLRAGAAVRADGLPC